MIIHNGQKGVSLVIAFLIMTTALAVVLSMTSILFSEIIILKNIGDSVSSLYAAESGIEQVLYFDRKQIPNGSMRGLCNICNVCNTNTCSNCLATSLSGDGANGCDTATCSNCNITYSSTFGDKSYRVNTRVVPNASDPALSDLIISAQGSYKNASRAIETISTNTEPLVP